MEKWPQSIKKFPDGHVRFAQPGRPPAKVPFSFLPFSLLLSRFWSVQVSVSLYYCNHHVCKNLCWVSRARLCCLSAMRCFYPFFITGRARPLIVTLYSIFSNLSWNTNDETLSAVRQIFFLALPALSVPDSEPPIFLCDVMAYCQRYRPFSSLAPLLMYASVFSYACFIAPE